MAATYNWAYQPSVVNKYGFTVPAGADTARPSGWCYVALFGNDITGNGSRNYPYKTIAKALTIGGTSCKYVLGGGVYREGVLTGNSSMYIIGDGDVTIDITLITNFLSTSTNLYNITFRGQTSAILNGVNTAYITDCTFNNVYLFPSSVSNCFNFQLTNCIFINSFFRTDANSLTNFVDSFSNNTFYRSNVYFGQLTASGQVYGFVEKNIFVECNIWIMDLPAYMDYSLFHNCNYRFSASAPTFPTAFYPSVPTGFTYYNTIANMKTAVNTAFGSSNVFNHCVETDPLFNNASINDFSLQFTSPAKNQSYNGTYIGAKSIAYQIKASATESTGNFDFSTNVNLTVANDSIVLTSTASNGEIKTKLIVNTTGRQIQKLPIFGFNADRNGQYIDSIADLSGSTIAAGGTLGTLTPYIVETGAITYNGQNYVIGDRFTTVAGITTFTTSSGGIVREILEAPERHTVMMRCGDSTTVITAGTALTVGYWYYVQSGSVTYDSTTYTSGQSFKAVDTNAFTGTGVVILALSTEAFQHYEPGIQPTSNNTGDTRTGTILRGNGDPAYVRGGIGVKEFPINAKFIQLYYIINVSNLKP